MGTRSLTYIYDGEKPEHPIVVMYRQYDGYPSGHGAELADFLSDRTIVNGIGSRDSGKISNGAGDLAAQLITHFKMSIDNGPGGFYLMYDHAKPNDIGAWQDYTYRIYASEKSQISVVVEDRNERLFVGNAAAFETFCTEPVTA